MFTFFYLRSYAWVSTRKNWQRSFFVANAVTGCISGNSIMSCYSFASMSSPNAEDQPKHTYPNASSYWRLVATPSVHSVLSTLPRHLSRSPLSSIHCLNVGFPLHRILLSHSSACRVLCENRVRPASPCLKVNFKLKWMTFLAILGLHC